MVMVVKKKAKKANKAPPPAYMVVDGYVYENIGKEKDSVPVTIDIDDETAESIATYRKNNMGFISDQEVIRHILREQIKNLSE